MKRNLLTLLAIFASLPIQAVSAQGLVSVVQAPCTFPWLALPRRWASMPGALYWSPATISGLPHSEVVIVSEMILHCRARRLVLTVRSQRPGWERPIAFTSGPVDSQFQAAFA